MGILQQSPQAASTPQTSMARRQGTYWPLFTFGALLCALSITIFSLISSMVAWLLDQKHQVHAYRVDWPGNPARINVEPENLWTDQGHASNGLAVYGFFLGVFGMLTAWRTRKNGQVTKSLIALTVLFLLGAAFSMSAFIFVFVVTYQTTGQRIREPIALNAVGLNYPAQGWTPETWFRAMLDLPLANGSQHAQIKSRVRSMEAWRWMLLPLLLVYTSASYVTVVMWLRRRREVTARTSSADSVEKTGA